MSHQSWKMSRRACIRGAGAALALPLLEVMMPGGQAQAQSAAIKRFMAIYFPHGAIPRRFWPTTPGSAFTLSPILASLAPFTKELNILQGFANRPGGVFPAGTDEGNGIHARHTGSFLTATALRPNQTSGGRENEASTGNGVSVDQLMAQSLGKATCVPSLALGARGGEPNNEGEDQFGGVYMNNISWSTGNAYVAKEINPLNLFNRLTGCKLPTSGSPTAPNPEANTAAVQRSLECNVMSAVNEQAKTLMNKVSKADQLTLDQFFTSVNELGKRCQAATPPPSASGAASVTQCTVPTKPGAAETVYQGDLRLIMDLAVFAMQCDLTRISTLMIAGAFEYRNFNFYNASATNPHDMTHNASQYDNWAKVTTWTVEQYAYLLGKMKAVNEGNKTLLDNSIVYLGSEFGDGSSHEETDLACLVAGSAGGIYKTGQYLKFNETPRANLYLDFLQTMGVNASKFGDSTGAFTSTRA